MAVIPDDIAVELGRPLPLDQATDDRWQSWVDRTVRQINWRAERLGIDPLSLDSQIIDDVVLLAVSEHARNPDGVDTYDVSIDDGRESRRYKHSKGAITITDEWWGWLFPSVTSGAFSTLTYGTPDADLMEQWW